jgi:polyphosphate kinase
MVRLPEPQLVAEIGEMLDLAFWHDTAAWELQSNGDWVQNRGQTAYQETLIERHRRRRTGG